VSGTKAALYAIGKIKDLMHEGKLELIALLADSCKTTARCSLNVGMGVFLFSLHKITRTWPQNSNELSIAAAIAPLSAVPEVKLLTNKCVWSILRTLIDCS
jgi:hypothetical protein